MPGRSGYRSLNHIPRKRYPANGIAGLASEFRQAGFDQPQAQGLARILTRLLERQTDDETFNYTVIEERMNSEILPFSTTGTGLPTTLSKPWIVRFGGKIREIRAALDTAGSTDTVVSIKINGVEITTITITAGNTTATKLIPKRTTIDNTVVKGDIATVQVTSAGTGASGLSVQEWVYRD